MTSSNGNIFRVTGLVCLGGGGGGGGGGGRSIGDKQVNKNKSCYILANGDPWWGQWYLIYLNHYLGYEDKAKNISYSYIKTRNYE